MNITTFDFNGNAVRTVEKNSEMLWVAKDVCDCLGLTNSRMAVEGLDEDELVSVKLTSGGQSREVQAVTEAGLYQLIFKSRKEEAKAFKKWVTHEVLPSIRKTGSYTQKTFDFEEAPVEAEVFYDTEGREIPDPSRHRYKLPETITPSWIKCIVDLYGKRVAGNYFAAQLGVPQEALALPKIEITVESSEMAGFINDCLILDPEESITTEAVYRAYLAWGGGLSKVNFGKAMKMALKRDSRVANIDGKSVRVFDGVTLKGV